MNQLINSTESCSAIRFSQKGWMMRPERNFGSNQVDLGGIVNPASATESTSSIRVGNMEKAIICLSEFTRFSSSFMPRIPPTK